MRLSKTHRDHSLGFVMTPMIDIVFLLIIFFLTVSQITRVVEHPMPLSKVERGAAESVPTTVTINLDDQGNIIVSGERFTLDRTINTLRNKLAQLGNDPTRIQIELRCHRECPTQEVNRLMRRLSEIGFQQVYAAVSGE